MKLIRSKSLYFKDSKSDKVYEVDLCEVDSELFVVNFRYGRTGSNLREGTKTVFPVGYEEASTIFDKLVKSKEYKGYAEIGNENGSIKQTGTTENRSNIERKEVILKYLKEATLGNYTRDWKLSRIIWRAGFLNIQDAAEYVRHFVTAENEFEQYAAIWTLTKFNDVSSVSEVTRVFQLHNFKNKTGRIAAAYLLNASTQGSETVVINSAKQQLPESITEKEGFSSELLIHFMEEKDNLDPLYLYYLYVLAVQDRDLRQQLYPIVNRLPLKINTFKSFRYIFKTAEALQDFEFYTLVAKRIAIAKPGYTGHGMYDQNWRWISAEEEMKKENPKIAFSGKTKTHLINATYKKVYNLSISDTDAYVNLATELLCALDSKADKTKNETQYSYEYDENTQRYEITKQQYPKYADFIALMYILYGNSQRFYRSKKRWYYQGEIVDFSAQQREEILPEVWDKKPEKVLHILANSKSEEAILFSKRIIEDNKDFLNNISETILKKIITHKDGRVVELIVEVLEKRYVSEYPEPEIVLALLMSGSSKAEALGFKWLRQHERQYFTSSDFLARLLQIEKTEVIQYINVLYGEKLAYNLPQNLDKLAPLFTIPSSFQVNFLEQINELISETYFGQLFKNVSKDRIHELFLSASVTNRLFAATLSKVNAIPSYELSKDFIESYLGSEERLLRKAGIELLSDFPDTYLLARHSLIAAYCFSEYPEVRQAIQPTVQRLLVLNQDFKESLLHKLLQTLINEETYAGVHESSYQLLIKFYGDNLQEVDQEGIIALVLSKYEFAQKLGTSMFQKRVQLQNLTIKKIISLSTSDVKLVRDVVQVYFESDPSRINYEFDEALKIFHTNWKDTLEWAYGFFENHIKPENWTLDRLLYVCDHTNEEVQAFGRKMMTSNFRKEDGLPMLLKLQEHPSKTMQFFATNYLDIYARDSAETILKLESFFKTALFAVNMNAVTKIRIFSFLEKESVKHESVARMAIKVLDSILSTKSIKDKSKCIDILLAINEAFPDIQIPIQIKTESHAV